MCVHVCVCACMCVMVCVSVHACVSVCACVFAPTAYLKCYIFPPFCSMYIRTYICLYPPSNCHTPVQELERQHGAVLALGFVGKHALLQSIDRTLHMVAESQADPVELASKRPRAGDITLDVVTKLGEWQAVVLWS